MYTYNIVYFELYFEYCKKKEYMYMLLTFQKLLDIAVVGQKLQELIEWLVT